MTVLLTHATAIVIVVEINVVVWLIVIDIWQLQSSWQQMQTSQVNVSAQINCLTEEMSVIQTAKDQVLATFAIS